jgi:FAD/FMN-containing dehydrogenase
MPVAAPPVGRSVRALELNDIHSGLNPTRIAGLVRPRSLEQLARIIRHTAAAGGAVSIAGGRHAMGGQQFGAGTLHLDTRGLHRVLSLDTGRGIVEAEAGIMWPDLVAALHDLQPGDPCPWTIAQKQTGADRMTLGGSLSANIHGRGLTIPPLVADLEGLTLVDADGRIARASRTENPALFRLAVGGYGLSGAAYSVRLRLIRRQVLRRRVVMTSVEELWPLLQDRIAAGFRYGDFQFAIDPASPDFLRRGICSCYQPIDPRTPLPDGQRTLTPDDWRRLLTLAHRDKSRGFAHYAAHYLATDGQLYHSDAAQLGVYVNGYHAALDRPGEPGGEMISELYVPPESLPAFMSAARRLLRATGADLIYGTIRAIRRDDETVLAWARGDWACIVINLCTPRTPAGIDRSARAFRGLIEAAAALGGSFYLTYHRFATHDQLQACHPRLVEFLRAKQRLDPAEVFRSDWYQAMKVLFQGELA